MAPTISGGSKLSPEVLPETFTHPKLSCAYRSCEEGAALVEEGVGGWLKMFSKALTGMHLGVWGEIRELQSAAGWAPIAQAAGTHPPPPH